MSLIQTLQYAQAAGSWVSNAEVVRFFVNYSYVQSALNVNFTRAALIDGLDTLTPLPIRFADANIKSVFEMRRGITFSGFNPFSTLTTQGGGQIWTDLVTPKEVKLNEDAKAIEKLDKEQKKIKNSPFRTSLMRASMAERRLLLEEKRNAYRREELRLAREEKEKRLGVVKNKRKYPTIGKKRNLKSERLGAEQNTNTARNVWTRRKQKGIQ